MEEIIFENTDKLVIGENSRWRANSNLEELMEGIKQVGILQPIVARKEDKVVICGNRRLAAAIKLGLENVPVRFLSNIDDKKLLILNLQENMQRKDITSLEIGKLCDSMLKNSKFKLSLGELAVSLGISEHRVKVCLETFRRLPPDFRKNVVHITTTGQRKTGDLPENVVFAILNFNRTYRRLNEKQIILFLKEAADKKLTTSQIRLIGILYTRGMELKDCLKQVENYKIIRLDLIALKTELGDVSHKEKIKAQNELFKKIVSYKYPNLLF